ncbi:MAG: hypothetical protein N3A63_00470 [Bacteroidetes bacterium]|nr:hypothetical protein [Bacteroidota bacterium]
MVKFNFHWCGVICLCFVLISNTQSQQCLVFNHHDHLHGIRMVSSAVPSIEYTNSKKKSVVTAVMLSLVLPGTGEWYVGNSLAARYHLLAEGGIWIAYTTLKLRSQWLLEDARSFARVHAGASFQSTDDEYDVNIGNYISMEAYNNAKLIAREYDRVYTDSRFAWQWDSDANRRIFKSNRIKSSEAKNYARFVLGIAVLNRLISAFRAGRMASSYNTELTNSIDVIIVNSNEYAGVPTVHLHVRTSF